MTAQAKWILENVFASDGQAKDINLQTILWTVKRAKFDAKCENTSVNMKCLVDALIELLEKGEIILTDRLTWSGNAKINFFSWCEGIDTEVASKSNKLKMAENLLSLDKNKLPSKA